MVGVVWRARTIPERPVAITEFDAETFGEQAMLIGLISRDEMYQARMDAVDGSLESMCRVMMRKGMLTSWQRDKLLKGEVTGFFFGGCKVLFHIAEGTFARVYRGEREKQHLPVAVKVLRRRFTVDKDAVARFNQEAEAGMKLRHPNIVKILDFGEQDKNHYMIMEYVEGSNLRDFLKIRLRLSPAEALPMMLGLSRALQHSLEQGVTHRDIKGTNILIGSRGEAKLVDFGLATIEADETRMAVAHGQRTVDYSALERTCGSAKGDPRSDIYFLGCVFYQMLTGVLPLPEVETHDPLAKMLKRSFGAIKPLSEHRHAPDPGLTRIVEKMMQVELRKRFASIGEVVKELEQYQETILTNPLAATPESNRRAAKARPVEAPVPVNASGERDLQDVLEAAARASQKQILCVEVQDSIQNAFRKVLSGMGYKVIIVGDAELAVERYDESPPDCVVFDVDGLGAAALDSFLAMQQRAREDGHDLAALVLLGPRQAALAARIPKSDQLTVLKKPLKMKEIQDAIAHLAPPM